jgi:hypothetical protein
MKIKRLSNIVGPLEDCDCIYILDKHIITAKLPNCQLLDLNGNVIFNHPIPFIGSLRNIRSQKIVILVTSKIHYTNHPRVFET